MTGEEQERGLLDVARARAVGEQLGSVPIREGKRLGLFSARRQYRAARVVEFLGHVAAGLLIVAFIVGLVWLIAFGCVEIARVIA